MLVKCWDIQEKRPREECFKAPNKKYYSSEEAYQIMVRQTEWKNKCTNKMQDIMGYDHDMKLPTSWYKFISEFKKYGYDVIYDNLEANEKTFLWALQNKSFKNDTHALSYFKAIIQNSVMEQYRAKKAREKEALLTAIEENRPDPIPSALDLISIGRSAVKGKDLSGLVGSIT